MPSPTNHDEDDEISTSLLNQAYLRNPVHHKPITFVPAACVTLASPASISTSTSAADHYFSVVFGSTAADSTPVSDYLPDTDSAALGTEPLLCPACHLPLPLSTSENTIKPHECLLAHQLSLPHSHPPSHLPRSNKGLQYLSSYGWDPDSRDGLGADGKGIRVPIKPQVKADTAGLGIKINKSRKEKPRPVMLDAGKVRKLEKKDKRQREALQREFWGRDEVEKYLGPG